MQQKLSTQQSCSTALSVLLAQGSAGAGSSLLPRAHTALLGVTELPVAALCSWSDSSRGALACWVPAVLTAKTRAHFLPEKPLCSLSFLLLAMEANKQRPLNVSALRSRFPLLQELFHSQTLTVSHGAEMPIPMPAMGSDQDRPVHTADAVLLEITHFLLFPLSL